MADLIVAALVALTQIAVGCAFFADWKPHLSRPLFRCLFSALLAIWVVSIAGIAFDSAGIHSATAGLAVGVEITWGFASGLAVAIYGLFRLTGNPRATAVSQGRRRVLRTAAIAAPFALTGFGMVVERTRYEVKEVDFPLPGLHPDLEGLRIVQISDLHVSPFLSVREASRVVDIANGLKPHLALVTGDLISERGDPLDGTIKELARLRADAGVLGCLGNHEIYARCEAYTAREARRRGMEFLRGEARQLRFGKGVLNVAGVDFQSFSGRKNYLHGMERLVLPGATNLLLSHNPDVFPAAVRQGFDGIAAGHTHGGQVTVEILNRTLNLARFFTPYVAGLYRIEGRSCYVNAGIGTIGMPVRIGAPPEITLLRLRRA